MASKKYRLHSPNKMSGKATRPHLSYDDETRDEIQNLASTLAVQAYSSLAQYERGDWF